MRAVSGLSPITGSRLHIARDHVKWIGPVSDQSPIQVGERLRQARQQRTEYNQRQAGEAGAGVDRKTVSAWEKGDRLPQLGYVLWLCKEAQVSPMWLLLNEGPMELQEARQTDRRAGALYVARKVKRALNEALDPVSWSELDGGPDAGDNGVDGDAH